VRLLSSADELTGSARRGRPRLNYADAMRACAIIMVVVLHMSATVVVHIGQIATSDWWVANVFEAAARPAVPLFVMTSGLLLLDPARDGSISSFVLGRVRRVVLPFVGWALIYLGWRVTYHGEHLSFGRAVHEVVSGHVYTHLWFVYMILGLYLLTPILRVYVRHASGANQRYFVALWLLMSSLVPFLERWSDITVGLDRVVTVNFVGYFVLGHVLDGIVLTRPSRVATWAALAMALGVTAAGTGLLSARPPYSLDESLYDYFSPNVVIMSVAVFVLITSARPFPANAGTTLAPGVRWLAGASFGIYLAHPIVQELFQGGLLGFRLHGLVGPALIAIPLASLAVVAVSALIVALLRWIGTVTAWLAP
jgi:surface polysaccharide O-acyltransferase-like enzyme